MQESIFKKSVQHSGNFVSPTFQINEGLRRLTEERKTMYMKVVRPKPQSQDMPAVRHKDKDHRKIVLSSVFTSFSESDAVSTIRNRVEALFQCYLKNFKIRKLDRGTRMKQIMPHELTGKSREAGILLKG